MSQLQLRVGRGTARSFTLQSRSMDQTQPCAFSPSTPLFTRVSRLNAPAAVVFAPPTSWVDAERGLFRVDIAPTHTATLELGVFAIITTALVNDAPLELLVGRLEITTDAAWTTKPLPDLATTVEAAALIDNLSDRDYEALPALLSRASQAIRTYCNQILTYQRHDELFASREGSRLVLRQIPVRAVLSVAGDPRAALLVRNVSRDNQRAWCSLIGEGDYSRGWESTGLALESTSLGQPGPGGEVAWIDAPTIGSAAAAVSDLGGGWAGFAAEGLEDDPAAELRATTTTRLACDGGLAAKFALYVQRRSDYILDDAAGILELNPPWTSRQPWAWPNAPEEIIDRGLPITVGAAAHRVVYEAGYKTITAGFDQSELPGDLMEALGVVLRHNLARRKVNPMFQSRSLADYSYSLSSTADFQIPPQAREILAAYRDAGRGLES